MRRSASVRVGLLLTVSALLSCRGERPPERRCVDADGQFVDEARCQEAAGPVEPAPDGGVASATGEWDAGPAGPTGSRGGFHFIWIPYGAFGGLGTYAPGYVRPVPGAGPGGTHGGPGASSVSRGGFGATGAAHASPATAGT